MPSATDDLDLRVRLAAFQFLEEQCSLHGEVLDRQILSKGFQFEGTRVPLVSPQGIFKPVMAQWPLTISTVPVEEGKSRPYEDEVGIDGLMRYCYRGTDPMHRDNVGLRRAMERQIPLVYFFGLVPGRYMPVWPVYIVGDDPGLLSFTVAFGEKREIRHDGIEPLEQVIEAQRAYITVAIQRRLHQASFRFRVIQAYREHCAVCRLRHSQLLDAAHILPDSHPRGEPWVSNGLALCKLHHAAFDSHMLGVRPDLIVEIRGDILDETDGPMLTHGLQDCHGRELLVLPSSVNLRPKPEFLEERYALFRKAG